MENRSLKGWVEIDAVLSLLKKVPGPFSASFLFFTRNNRQIMPPDYSGVKNLFCYVQRRAVLSFPFSNQRRCTMASLEYLLRIKTPLNWSFGCKNSALSTEEWGKFCNFRTDAETCSGRPRLFALIRGTINC